jgi:uncharacterized protein (DUF433 family)
MAAHTPTAPPQNGSPDLVDRVAELESRVAYLERLLVDSLELPLPPWRHLVQRPRSWRAQPFVRGRNLTVRHVVGAMRSEGRTPEETAADLDISVEAVRESMAYYDLHRGTIDAETALERAGCQGDPGTPG